MKRTVWLWIGAAALALGGCGSNQAPTATILSPGDGELLRTLEVEFAAAGEDPEGSPLTFEWTFGDGGTGSGERLTHAFESGGAFTVTLTVRDAGDRTATDTIAIKVNSPPAVASTIQSDGADGPLKFISGEAPFQVSFDASQTVDRDGSIFSYAWDFGDGTGGAPGPTPTHTYGEPGEYTVAVTVTDNMGAVTRDNSIRVSVKPPPTEVILTDPADGSRTYVVRMVTDGGVSAYEPDFLRIQPGDTVRWVNAAGVHATAAYAPDNQRSRGIPEGAQGWDSGLLTAPFDAQLAPSAQPTAYFEHTFTVPGTYGYFCLPNEAQGMVGTIEVGDGVPQLSQDFINGLPSAETREAFARQIGQGIGGVIHTIELGDANRFSPAVLQVKPGDTIRWINTGRFPHTVTSYHPDFYGKALGLPAGVEGWDSGLLDEGAAWSLTIPSDAPPGSYAYFCLPHEALGMVGLLVVDAYTPLSEAFISTLPEQARETFLTLMAEAADQ